jgi:hypothetical protein
MGLVRAPHKKPLVNGIIYMHFREAVDALCESIGHEQVAEALGVSVQTIRQAWMNEDSSALRAPPKRLGRGAIRLAEAGVWYYRELIDRMRNVD